MIKVLFLAMHRPNRSPSQRFRFEQYFDFLAKNGVTCQLSYLIEAKDDQVLYNAGNYFAKLFILIRSILKRHSDLFRSKNFDYVFIQREAFMTGSTLLERMIAKSGTPIIFDFDDSIWLADTNEANKALSFLKNPAKTAKIIKISSQVIAGNDFLASYAKKHNSNCTIIPTTIDTSLYKPKEKQSGGPIVVGWSGSFSTIKHFEEAINALKSVKSRFGNNVEFKVIGDENYKNEVLEITGQKWDSSTEVADLQEFDIGIMPLPDSEWAKGKCGLKGLQYMGLAIPTIMSPVGVNNEIIEDGVNGFLASSKEEWVEKLSQLIESPELRKRLGDAGRKTVVDKYSVEANKQKYLELFQQSL